MNRQEFIASLPHWLRERANELLRDNAESFSQMPRWSFTDEGYDFWFDCHLGDYEEALKLLKETRPEVYYKHYAKHFKTISPTSTTRYSGLRIIRIEGVFLAQGRISNTWVDIPSLSPQKSFDSCIFELNNAISQGRIQDKPHNDPEVVWQSV